MTTTQPRRHKTGGTTRDSNSFTFTGRQPISYQSAPGNDHFHFQREDVDCLFSLPSSQIVPPMADQQTVEIEDRHDRWRFTCPRRHRDWEPTNHHFWCAACARSDGVDGTFAELRDRMTGRLIDREDVKLQTEAGPYDKDLDRRGSA